MFANLKNLIHLGPNIDCEVGSLPVIPCELTNLETLKDIVRRKKNIERNIVLLKSMKTLKVILNYKYIICQQKLNSM